MSIPGGEDVLNPVDNIHVVEAEVEEIGLQNVDENDINVIDDSVMDESVTFSYG